MICSKLSLQLRFWCYRIIVITTCCLLLKDDAATTTVLSHLVSTSPSFNRPSLVNVKYGGYTIRQWQHRQTTLFKPTYYTSSFSHSRISASTNNLLIESNNTSADEPYILSDAPKVHDVQNDIGSHHCSSSDSSTIPYRNKISNGCVVELIEPETNCIVRIIGVFHGSRSSSNDVLQFASSSSCGCDMMVLELCSDRYRDLILHKKPSSSTNSTVSMYKTSGATQDIIDSEEEEEEDDDYSMIATSTADESKGVDSMRQYSESTTSWLEQYVRVVRATIHRQGWKTGIVVAIFGLVNGFQQEIVQLQPGLEFITASEMAKNDSIPIILADQDVTMTLQRISQIPQVAYEMWSNLIWKQSWNESFGPPSFALSLAIFGGWMIDAKQKLKLLTLPQFLTRDLDSIQDVLRLVGLPILVLQVFNVLLTFPDEQSTFTTVADTNMLQQALNMTIIMSLLNSMVIVLFYLSVALPATQVIIMERDDVLTSGIRAACRIAKVRNGPVIQNSIGMQKYDAPPDAIVVVVLGLLHVNGVADRLSKRSDQEEL